MKPAQNDCVLFVPHKTRFPRRKVAGLVQEVINNGNGGIGCNIFSPLPTDPTRVQRVWAEDGTITVTHRIQRKAETEEWLVVKYIDGKRDEAGTYYTTDKQDAIDTLIFIAAQETVNAEKPLHA
jgi:hypothetical protein